MFRQDVVLVAEDGSGTVTIEVPAGTAVLVAGGAVGCADAGVFLTGRSRAWLQAVGVRDSTVSPGADIGAVRWSSPASSSQ